MRPRRILPSGVGVALVTIFDGRGRPDVSATSQRAHSCVERGIGFVLVAGTTGEAWRLDTDDRIALTSAVKRAVGGRPVLVGTGDPVAARARSTTRALADADVADGLLVLSPRDQDPLDFYRALRDEAPDATLLAYHMPTVSPPGVPVSVVPSLPVDGIKDSSGSADRLAELLANGAEVYVGSANLLTLAGRCGARGGLVAMANLAPELCTSAWSGDLEAQVELMRMHASSMADFPERFK